MPYARMLYMVWHELEKFQVLSLKDLKIVPLMFVILGKIKGHIPWLRDPDPQVQRLRLQR